jgi:hypothetical protein
VQRARKAVRRLRRNAPPTQESWSSPCDVEGPLADNDSVPSPFGQEVGAVLDQSVDQVPRDRCRRQPSALDGAISGPTLQPPARVLTPASEKSQVPPELVHLLGRSALRSDVQSVFQLCEKLEPPCQRSLHGIEEDDEQPAVGVTLDVGGNPYSVSANKKKELFRFTDPKELSLPPPPPRGARQVRVEDFISDRTEEHLDACFPFNLLFTEENLERCRLTEEEMPKRTGPHTSLNLAPGVTKLDLAKHLIKHGVADLFTEETPGMLEAESCGSFSLLKAELPVVKTRFVFDGVNNNRPYSMPKMQQIYLELLAMYPVRAMRLGLSEKIMDMPNPQDVCDMPGGAVCVSTGDYSDYFYQIHTYFWLIASQAFGWFDGADFGRPEQRVRLAMIVLAMGNWLSALIAHVLHRAFLNRVFAQRATALRALPSKWASPEHRQDLEAVRTLAALTPDGMVAWADVPLRMRRKVSRMLEKDGRRNPADAELGLMEELRLPVDALAMEPLPPGVTGITGEPAVRLVTTLPSWSNVDQILRQKVYLLFTKVRACRIIPPSFV